MVTQILFFTSRSRTYTKMDIDFLCTRVSIPYKDDFGNLVRVIRYIRGTLNLSLILSSGILSVIKFWVDASFYAHPNYKGHTGAIVPMGLVSIMELSRKK